MTRDGYLQPKILLEIDGKTLLEHLLDELEREEFTEVVFCLGFQAHEVLAEIDELRRKITIKTFVEEDQRGTLGALIQAKDLLSDCFTLVMGDCFIYRTNLGGVHQLVQNKAIDACILSKFTDHPDDSDLLKIDAWGNVTEISTPPHSSFSESPHVGLSGVLVLRKESLSQFDLATSGDLTGGLLSRLLVNQKKVVAIFHQGLIRDLGTKHRLESFNPSFHLNRKPDLLNTRSVFLDRDGTLNRHSGHITNYSQIEILPSAQRLMTELRLRKIQAIVISNQPVVARGEATLEQVLDLTKELIRNLGFSEEELPIYICPHYPESGFADEVLELKVRCTCRKPNPGLLLLAAEENNLRLTKVTFFGDTASDMQAALLVGAEGIHLHQSVEQASCEFENFSLGLIRCIPEELSINSLSFREELN